MPFYDAEWRFWLNGKIKLWPSEDDVWRFWHIGKIKSWPSEGIERSWLMLTPFLSDLSKVAVALFQDSACSKHQWGWAMPLV